MMHVSPGLSRKLFGSQCSNNGQVNEDSEDDDQATDLNAFGSRHKGISRKDHPYNLFALILHV